MPKKPGICNKDMTFEECELAIVRHAVQMIEDKAGKKKINTPEIQDIIRIVEEFLLIIYYLFMNNFITKK